MRGSWLKVLGLLLFAILLSLLAGWWRARSLCLENLFPSGPLASQQDAAADTTSTDGTIYLDANALVFPGTIRPYKTASVKARLTAPINELLVEEGNLVRKGQVLCRLADKGIHQKTIAAQKTREQLLAAQRIQQQQETALRAELQRAQQELTNLQTAPPRLLVQATADAAQAAQQWEIAQARYREQHISGEQLSNQAEILTQAQAALREQFSAYQMQLREKQQAVDKAQDAWQQSKLSLTAVTTDLQAAQNTVDRLQERLTETQIIAPITGTVHLLSNPATLEAPKPGEQVAKDAVFLEIADISQACVRIAIAESDVGELWLGQPAIITGGALKDRQLSGKVAGIGTNGKRAQGRLFPVTVLITASEAEKIPMGLPVDVKIRFDAPRP